jgi:hypothetical protein
MSLDAYFIHNYLNDEIRMLLGDVVNQKRCKEERWKLIF